MLIHAVDVDASLHPATGIAREVRVIPPCGAERPLWTVAVDIGMGDRRDDGSSMDITWVGAAGFRRSPTIVRAAGEAVERAALMGPGALAPGAPGTDPAPVGMSWRPDVAIADSYAAVHRDRHGRTSVRVPVAAVDYPPADDAADVDPGPSGTASGIGLEAAVRSACKESIERDAAMRGWSDPAAVRRIDVDLVSGAAGKEIARLVGPVIGAGVEFTVLRLPTRAPAPAILTLAVDRERGVVGAGLGLEWGVRQSLLRSVQESLQIRTLLRDLSAAEERSTPALPIRREIDRARFWSSPAALDAVAGWLQLVPPVAEEPWDHGPILDWHALVERVTVVDLTPRLPVAARSLGWSVARVFAPDLCPLRMDESLAWNVPPAPARHAIPHPFV